MTFSYLAHSEKNCTDLTLISIKNRAIAFWCISDLCNPLAMLFSLKFSLTIKQQAKHHGSPMAVEEAAVLNHVFHPEIPITTFYSVSIFSLFFSTEQRLKGSPFLSFLLANWTSLYDMWKDIHPQPCVLFSIPQVYLSVEACGTAKTLLIPIIMNRGCTQWRFQKGNRWSQS